MTAEAAQSALRLKARANPSAVGPSAMDASKAIRVAVARAGDTALGVPVGVRDVQIGPVLPEALKEDDFQDAILLSLRDEHGAIGLAAACPQSLAAIIEASTLGAVLNMQADPRAPTHTDGVLVQSFLNDFLQALGALVEEIAHPPPVEGYQSGVAFEDLRAVKMGLEDAAHKQFRITVDFGLGAKVGFLTLVLPIHRTSGEEDEVAPDQWAASLEKAVLGTSAELEGILCRVPLTLADISTLNVGDVLPLPGAKVDGVALVAPNGMRVAGARLGKAGPMRALRIRLGAEEEMSDALASGAAAALPVPLSLPPAEDAGFGAPDLDLPMAEVNPDNFAMDLDIGGDADGVLGAIEPIQVPASEANQG